MNADAKTQAEADWVTRASAGFTTHLSTNAYTYATGIDVTGVNDDIAALNANLETQVKAEWVRNAQRDFHAWLVTKAYNDDVAAVITSTSQSIAQLNKAVEAKVASAHIGDADGEFQRWLTQRAYTYVAGVTIDEVDEDIAGMNAAVEAQITQRWVSDADAALQQWLSARGLASVVSASVTSTTQNLGSLNDDIDAQTVDDWVATENGGIAAWLQARGYDGAVPVASVQLDASDTSARVSGYPAYPASVNSAVQTAVEQDWIADAESDLRSWLVTKNYDGFVTTSDVFITTTSPNLAQINAVIETKVEQDWIDSTDAELQLWLSSNGYGDVVATVDDVAENFPTLNEDIETQAKADWVADAQAELTSYLTRNGYGYVTGASVTSVTQNLNTLNAVIASQVDFQWVTDANSALQAWLSGEGYQSLVSVSVTNSSPDFSEINADVETAVKADYVTSVNTEINQWVTDNELDDYFVAGTDKLSDTDDVPGDLSSINDAVSGKMENEWIAETNADFQNWLLAEFGANVTDASTLQITSADQDMAELNTQVENLARGLLPEMGDVYVPYDPVAFDGFVAFEVAEAYSYVQYAPAITSAPVVPNFAPSRGAFGSYVAFTPSSAYPAYVAFTLTNYPGYVAHTVASAFPDLTSEFTRTAFTYEAFTQGVSYAAYVPFALRNGAYPGFTEFEVDTFTFNAFTLAKYPTYVEFTNEDPYPAYVNFEMVPAYAHTPYVHLREHSFTPYSLQTPNHPRWWSDRYTRYWIRDPKQIDKHDMGKLFYYHKAWYYQEMFVCRATCVGTMGQNTEVDTDFLAPDRVCDGDDHLCPVANTPSPVGTNKHGAWEEFNLILEARDSHLGKHPECPVRDPCRTSPPPCFYVTSECIPDILVNTRINNTDLSSREDIEFNEDEKYLHEPMTVSDIVEWKLVSGRLDRPGAPKLWNYWTGLDMAAFTSPKDKQKYHKVCTFALVEKTTERFERGVEYGFSIAERNRKNEEGHTQAGQNSYRAPNHVYDVGHVGDIERWQRSFGETVSPLLDNECSGRFASQWRNRRYSPAQQFESVSKVWGTCADTCAQLSDASSSDSAAAEATLGVAQTINAVITRAAALGAKRGSGMGKQSQSGAKHVAVVFVSVAGIAALALAAARRHKNVLAAAERVPLLAKPAVEV